MNKELQKYLEHIAYNLRVSSILATTAAGSGHVTSCLSAADIVAVLFFHALHFDPQNPDNPHNDRFILSKGHAAPLLYAVWKELGIVSEQELLTLRQFDSVLEGHPTPRFSRSEAATGSLGQGLSIGAGMAYEARMDKREYHTFVLLGDSECAEGSVWEAAEVAAYYRLHNLIAVLDCNRLGQSTDTMSGHDVTPYVNKFSAFNWHVLVVDGHDIAQLIDAVDKARRIKEQPVIIIARTIKGYGVAQVEDKPGFHGKPFSTQEEPVVLKELARRFSSAIAPTTYVWNPHVPATENKKEVKKSTPEYPKYPVGEKFETRKVYGEMLAALGYAMPTIVSLDAEVKNSTFADIFEKAHPQRFVQCFIAEQNMIGMAVGLTTRGKITFSSTFGVFFSRAFDQIRMAAIGRVPLRLVGSHAGVSIGEDGPSQMALEDIALMRTLPDSIVLYPADAPSTVKLVELIAHYNDGISYLRTTRSATPVLYSPDEQFKIGGCKIVRSGKNDVACVVAAGITLYEALTAYERLKKEGIEISVIDAYSIKPLDAQTISRCAAQSGKRVITVEDHYLQGGLGEALAAALCNDGFTISSLAVTKLPRSGTPEKLRAYEDIDADAIIRAVKK